MKKLTKINLKGLEKKMNVICEDVQRNYVGGYAYYDQNGTKLGQVGNSTDIRICSADAYSTAFGSCGSGSASSGSQVIGTSLVTSSFLVKESFFQGMADQYADKYTNFQLDGMLGSEVGAQTVGCAGQSVTLSINNNCSYVYNEQDLISILKHENTHETQDCSLDTNTSEFNAYYQQVTSPNFNNCDKAFKDGILNSMAGYASQCNKNEYTSVADIKKMLGLNY